MYLKPLATLLIFLAACGLFAGLDMKPADTGFTPPKEPREEKLDAFLVAGVSVMDTMEQEAMMGTWTKFFDILPKIPTAIGEVYYGVNFLTENYDPEKGTGYGYMACTRIKSEEGLPEGLTVRKIPESLYLVFTHKGPLELMGETFAYIYGQYLPASKYQVLMADALEVYGDGFDSESPESEIEIWVPVLPKE